MNVYRKILPLLKRAFTAARVTDTEGQILFNDFEDYAATLMTDLTLEEAKGMIDVTLRKLLEDGLTPEQIQDHEDLQIVLMYAGNSEYIQDADELEDYITMELGLHE